MLGKIGALPEELREPETLLAGAGYFSGSNVEACAAAGIEPLIAMGRQPHHPPLRERFASTWDRYLLKRELKRERPEYLLSHGV
jgi:hypothetical protein